MGCLLNFLRVSIRLSSIKTPLDKHGISKWRKNTPAANHDFVFMGTITSVWTAPILCCLWKLRQLLFLWPYFSSKGSEKIQDRDQSLTLGQKFHIWYLCSFLTQLYLQRKEPRLEGVKYFPKATQQASGRARTQPGSTWFHVPPSHHPELLEREMRCVCQP